MAAVDLTHSYDYAQHSELRRRSAAPSLLALATSGGVERHPYFYEGRMTAPRRAADLMLAVAQVARSRFYTPPGMLARILAAADPVVTSNRGCLRFEGFSACCGIYARLDLLPTALEGDVVGTGTTNVDFNPDMRAALAQLGQTELVDLAVGDKQVELRRETGTTIERKVPLPARWLKGFVEVAAYQARMQPAIELKGAAALRFLRTLPRASLGAKVRSWVEPVAGGARMSMRDARGSFAANGLERVRLLEALARDAMGLRIYSDGTATTWELSYVDARFTLAMSPESGRGFSGEGQVLVDLAGGKAELVERVQAALKWGARIDENEIARLAGANAADVRSALAALSSRGIVGYDLAEGAYFRRELPFDLAQVDSMHPRLRAARELVAAGAVSRHATQVHVRSDDVTHRVTLKGGQSTCTCPWYAANQGNRGPCKHVLAAQLWEDANGGH